MSGKSRGVSGSGRFASLRISEGVALQLRHEVVAGAHAERHDGKRGILAGVRGEAGSVHDEKILNVVRLLELIENGFFRVGAHTGDSGFVKRPTRGGWGGGGGK